MRSARSCVSWASCSDTSSILAITAHYGHIISAPETARSSRFCSVADAVRCAPDAQIRHGRAHRRPSGSHRRIEFRVGIRDSAMAIEEADGELMGAIAGVNIGGSARRDLRSRVRINWSKDAHRQVKSRPCFSRCVDLGPQSPQNIAGLRCAPRSPLPRRAGRFVGCGRRGQPRLRERGRRVPCAAALALPFCGGRFCLARRLAFAFHGRFGRRQTRHCAAPFQPGAAVRELERADWRMVTISPTPSPRT